MPVVKIFGIFSDNFRLAVILAWSVIPVFAAFLFETCYPKHSRIQGIRLSVIAILFGMLLFCVNVLLYKQFPYSAPDAPYEVAAIILTNHILFALIAATVFEASRLMFKDLRMSVLSTFACISCSSYIFWAGTGKDHILTTAVFGLLILFWIRYLYFGRWLDATAAFIFSGLLVWVRPEIGFTVFCLLVLFHAGNLGLGLMKKSLDLKQALVSLTSTAGTCIGAVPFFLNNVLLAGNFFTPVVVAFPDRNYLSPVSNATWATTPVAETMQQVSEALSSVAISAPAASPSIGTIGGIFGMVSSRLAPLSLDTLGHFMNILFFPENHNVGFFLMCPLIPVALLSGIFWYAGICQIKERNRTVLLFLFLMAAAIVCSYIPEMWVLDTDKAISPDMRYLVPAYIPAGLLSVLILSKTPFLRSPGKMLKSVLIGSVILVPVFISSIIVIHPSGIRFAGYIAFFKYLILFGIVLCCLGILISRLCKKSAANGTDILPYLLIFTIITVFAFQFALTFVIGSIDKFNGYPFWIPMVREGYGVIFSATTLTPV